MGKLNTPLDFKFCFQAVKPLGASFFVNNSRFEVKKDLVFKNVTWADQSIAFAFIDERTNSIGTCAPSISFTKTTWTSFVVRLSCGLKSWRRQGFYYNPLVELFNTRDKRTESSVCISGRLNDSDVRIEQSLSPAKPLTTMIMVIRVPPFRMGNKSRVAYKRIPTKRIFNSIVVSSRTGESEGMWFLSIKRAVCNFYVYRIPFSRVTYGNQMASTSP